jgi:hypothetical protein
VKIYDWINSLWAQVWCWGRDEVMEFTLGEIGPLVKILELVTTIPELQPTGGIYMEPDWLVFIAIAWKKDLLCAS